jgi:hypothetical protein
MLCFSKYFQILLALSLYIITSLHLSFATSTKYLFISMLKKFDSFLFFSNIFSVNTPVHVQSSIIFLLFFKFTIDVISSAKPLEDSFIAQVFLKFFLNCFKKII